MSDRRMLKLIHIAGTGWFILCVVYVLVLVLRQAGFDWLVVFSLSGHSLVLALLLISLYLFAIVRSVGRNQKIEAENPLTSSTYYMVFYVATPFFGGVAGCFGMMGAGTRSEYVWGIVLGTLATTFLVWVVVDPVIGLLEMLLPASRKRRTERLAQAKVQQQRRQEERERLLAEIFAKEGSDRRRWQEMLKPEAEKLARLLAADRNDFEQAEREATDIGLKAWQVGGLSCMRQLRDIALAVCREKHQESIVIDYVSAWWDGIGSWRNPSFG